MNAKLLTILIAACGSAALAADAPSLIPFQARLTNQQGVAYTSGQYSLTFNIYDSAVGGATAWTERHEKVGVVNGTVNVFLGSINPALSAIDFSQTRYLGITIDADDNATTPDPEMVPRQLIIPAFYAKTSTTARKLDVLNAQGLPTGQSYGWAAMFNNGDPTTGTISGGRLASGTVSSAQILDGTVSGADIAPASVNATHLAAGVGTPPGTILPYVGVTAPTGYLLCNGASYARSGFSALSAVIGSAYGGNATNFNVPDLRGQFLRGAMPNLTKACSGTATASNVTATAHPFDRSGMLVRVTGTPVTGLQLNKDYYIIVVDSNTIAFALNRSDARSGAKIPVSGSAATMVVAQAEDPDVNSREASGLNGNSGALIGSVQGDAFARHTHGYRQYGVGGPFITWNTTSATWQLDPRENEPTGEAGTSIETRPKNLTVNYIIKF